MPDTDTDMRAWQGRCGRGPLVWGATLSMGWSTRVTGLPSECHRGTGASWCGARSRVPAVLYRQRFSSVNCSPVAACRHCRSAALTSRPHSSTVLSPTDRCHRPVSVVDTDIISAPGGSTPHRPLYATAQVTAAGRPSGRDVRFGTRSTPPPASAAASATDAVPTAASGALDGWGTGMPASRAAAYPRTGTPSCPAAPAIAGVSALVSTVASSTTEPGASPASRRVSSISPSTSPTEAARLAPTPTTRARSAGGASPGGGMSPAEGAGSDGGVSPGGAACTGSAPGRGSGAGRGCAEGPSDRLCRGAWPCSSRSARSS